MRIYRTTQTLERSRSGGLANNTGGEAYRTPRLDAAIYLKPIFQPGILTACNRTQIAAEDDV
jgi:hypothetical protein